MKAHCYTDEDVNGARTTILDQLHDIIYQREQILLSEVKHYERLFEQIRAGGILSEADENYVANLKKKIAQHQTLNRQFSFEDRYIARLGSHYASTLRGINNGYGINARSNIDIYFDAGRIVERVVREGLVHEKENIIGAISLVEQSASEASKLQPVMQILQEQVNQFFETVVMQTAVEMAQVIEDSLERESEASEFWSAVRSRWGRGSGFRNDVLDRYRAQLQHCDAVLAECVQEVWQAELMQKLLLFFGED
ncbi:hypothetical protein LEP3755_65780 (plasmid) [Leptolyngbya sp. NIES-3755]|nr:hypothetical protein LEP3755_65780 [Leptolyngbya sp. NIES-3755]